MKKILAAGIALFLAASPALALADALTPAQVKIQQLTAVIAALQAQEAALASGNPLACAALASKTSVRVNEPLALAWGSVGAMDPADNPSKPMWAQNGVSDLSIRQAGTWTYSFTFYSATGATTTCNATIIVVPTSA